ncbi:MAG: porin, partial [Pseudomonadota bacterium]|nr:porin [Pseudomonadota bacterium]
TFDARFAYKAEVSVAGGEAQWEDLLLEYRASDRTALSVGNFRTVSLENLTSSRYITFMERGPFNDVLGLGRTLNLAAFTHGANWSVSAALSGDNINDLDVAGDETHGASARATFAPVNADARTLHFGAWARYRDQGGEGALRYRARSNTNFGARYIDTGAFGSSDATLGLEAAVARGSVSLQGEYARLSAEAEASGRSADLDAFYVFGSWYVTGERRNYDAEEGVFGRTRVRRPVTQGGPGAVELAVRYERANLGEAFAAGAGGRAGEYRGVTLGANWRPIGYVRFMANYTAAQNDNPIDALDADVDTFQARAQFDF